MAGQKFFHGLTEGMMNKASDRPDRQKSSFYWPDEYMQDPEETYRTSSRRQSTASSVTSTPTKECASPASEFESAEVLKLRHRNNAQSHISFYDGSDSSFSQIERERQREKLRIEQFLREQSDDVSEMAKTRRQNTLKSSFQFYDTVDDSTGDRSPPKATSPTKHSNGYHPPQTPDLGESRYSPVSTNGDRARRQLSSPGGSSEYHYSARYTGSYDDFEDDRSFKSADFNFSPPGTPGGTDVTEHRRNAHRHLRSSINFSNGVAVADDSSAPRKTVSVREAASTQRVGVGLPNL